MDNTEFIRINTDKKNNWSPYGYFSNRYRRNKNISGNNWPGQKINDAPADIYTTQQK